MYPHELGISDGITYCALRFFQAKFPCFIHFPTCHLLLLCMCVSLSALVKCNGQDLTRKGGKSTYTSTTNISHLYCVYNR